MKKIIIISIMATLLFSNHVFSNNVIKKTRKPFYKIQVGKANKSKNYYIIKKKKKIQMMKKTGKLLYNKTIIMKKTK